MTPQASSSPQVFDPAVLLSLELGDVLAEQSVQGSSNMQGQAFLFSRLDNTDPIQTVIGPHDTDVISISNTPDLGRRLSEIDHSSRSCSLFVLLGNKSYAGEKESIATEGFAQRNSGSVLCRKRARGTAVLHSTDWGRASARPLFCFDVTEVSHA